MFVLAASPQHCCRHSEPLGQAPPMCPCSVSYTQVPCITVQPCSSEGKLPTFLWAASAMSFPPCLLVPHSSSTKLKLWVLGVCNKIQVLLCRAQPLLFLCNLKFKEHKRWGAVWVRNPLVDPKLKRKELCPDVSLQLSRTAKLLVGSCIPLPPVLRWKHEVSSRQVFTVGWVAAALHLW